MKGPAYRLIQSQGNEFDVHNATGGTGGRDTPDYSSDGTVVVGVLEQRGMPKTMKDSAGEDVETDLEIRAVPDDNVTIQTAGTADGYPTKLIHPSGQAYRVIDAFPEDSGVTVFRVVTD